MPVRFVAAFLILAVAAAPALNEVRAGLQASATQDQDPWEEQTPKELEENSFQKELSHAPLNIVCVSIDSGEAYIASDQLMVAHFLESPLHTLRRLRI